MQQQSPQNPPSSNPAIIRVQKKTYFVFLAAIVLSIFAIIIIVTYLNLSLIRTFFGLNVSAVSEVPGYTFTIENKKTLTDYLTGYKFFSRNVIDFEGEGSVHPASVVFKLVPKIKPYNKLFGGSKTPISTIGEHYNPKTKELIVAIHIDSQSLNSLTVSHLSFIASSEIIFFLHQITQDRPFSDMKNVSQIRNLIDKSLASKKLPVFQVKKQ
jgi:hypothetical protein